MTPEQRLQLLDELKAREGAAAKRAGFWAWSSVLAAGVVTALLLYGAYRELGRVEAEVASKKEELRGVREQLERDKVALEATRKRLQAWQSVVSEIPKPQLEAGFARAGRKDPNVEMLPRVYIQAPAGEEARKRAEEVRRVLRKEGFVVPGIEVRPEAVRETQVRYYKSTEVQQAEKVVAALRSAGEKVGRPVHLERYENSTAVRPNHYEVWLSSK